MALTKAHNRMIAGAPVNVLDFGAVGDGTTDDTAAIQAAINSNSVVRIPSGNYSVDTLTISSSVELYGTGTLSLRTAGTTLILVEANDVSINGLELIGSGNTAENLNENLIRVGPLATGSFTTTRNNLNVTHCTLKNSKGQHARIAYANGVLFENCTFLDARYASVLCLSALNTDVINCRIDGITGLASNSNAYGVAFTRDTTQTIGDAPRSQYCTAVNNHISNVATWNGLDTHGGADISFLGNTITDCGFPIGVVTAGSLGCERVTVSNNIIDSTGLAIASTNGIKIVGHSSSPNTNIVFSNNTLTEVGQPANSIAGALVISETLNTVISGNTFLRPLVIGINIYFSNKGFSVTGNTVIDTYDNTVTTASGITLRSTNNTGGVISGNTILATGATVGTYTAERGIYVVTGTGSDVVIGSNYSNYALPVYNYTALSTDMVGVVLTDSTSGTAGSTVATVGDTSTVNQGPTINNNFASLTAKVNQLIRLLEKNRILQ